MPKSLYKKKYARELMKGLRKDGKSIEEVCSLWGISADAYSDWRKKYPEFEEAHKQGDRDKRAWWFALQRNVAAGIHPGNAAVINFALKNENGYVDKTEVHNTHEEQITTLRIEVHKPIQDIGRIIEQEKLAIEED
jgi:hypothetical protein